MPQINVWFDAHKYSLFNLSTDERTILRLRQLLHLISSLYLVKIANAIRYLQREK